MKTNKENKNIFEDYEINENNFLLAIKNGVVFKTECSTVTGIKSGASVYYRQEFIYKFDNKFIKDNEEKLLKLGILEEN